MTRLPEAKIYELRRDAAGAVACNVSTWDADQDGTRTYALPHLVKHSPTGFEVGYWGSGPADLARSILGDAFGLEDPHPRAYQAFKEDVVAKVHLTAGGPPYSFRMSDVLTWAERRCFLAELLTPAPPAR